MRVAYALLVSLVFVVMQACSVDIVRTIPEQTIPGVPNAPATAQTLRFTNEQSAVDTSIAGRIELLSLTLDITRTAQPAGDTDCWNFVQSANVYIESTKAGTTLTRRLIASASAPGCVTTIDPEPVKDVNLQPYLKEGFRIITDVVATVPPDDVSFNGTIALRAGL